MSMRPTSPSKEALTEIEIVSFLLMNILTEGDTGSFFMRSFPDMAAVCQSM